MSETNVTYDDTQRSHFITLDLLLTFLFQLNAMTPIKQPVALSAPLKRTPCCAQSLGQIVARSP